MKIKSIHKLKQSEYSKGAIFGLQNAKNHFLVSLEAAKIQQYGIAKALLILGIEELAKSSILKIKSIYNLMVIKNLDNYFKYHETKHESIIRLFFASFSELEEKEDAILDNENGEVDKNKSNNLWIIGLIVVVILGFIFYELLKEDEKEKEDESKISSPKKEKNIFKEIKESGFYLGYNYENGTWNVPNQIHSQTDYKELKEITDMALGTIESTLFNGKIDKENIFKYAEKLQDKNIYPKKIKSFKKRIK